MFKKVVPYMGEYKKYTAFAAIILSLRSVVPIMYSIVDKYHIYAKREEN